jgi:hypothetical protein
VKIALSFVTLASAAMLALGVCAAQARVGVAEGQAALPAGLDRGGPMIPLCTGTSASDTGATETAGTDAGDAGSGASTPPSQPTTDDFQAQNLAPANGAAISYLEWLDADCYVTFTVQPADGYPCADENYVIELNGSQAGTFGENCSTSVYLPRPGFYSWQTVLNISETGTSVPGAVTSFTIIAFPAHFPAQPRPHHLRRPPRPASNTTAADTTPPVVIAADSTLIVGRTGKLYYLVSDNSGAASVALSVFGGATKVWSRNLRAIQAIAPAPVDHFPWTPTRRGTYRFCVAAKDPTGNRSQSCATVSVV